MRVLHVIPSVATCRGGPSEAVLAMARALNRNGVHADVLTTDDDGPGRMDVPTGEFVTHRDARVLFLPRWSPPVKPLREFRYASALGPWLKAHIDDYDCLHVHGLFAYLSSHAMHIARAAHKPYIQRPFGLLDPWSLQRSALKKRIYFALGEWRNLQAAAAIHCTSENETAHVRDLLPQSRAVTIPHGADPRPEVPEAAARLRAAYGVAESSPVILFLSRWHPKKNIELLIESLANMQAQPWTLLLAGSTDDAAFEQRVRACIASHGLGGRVICPGHLAGEAKDLALQGADFFVLPSISENFGIAVTESLVCGRPVIVSEGVDLASVVRELNGGAVCQATSASLTQALRDTLAALPAFTAMERERLRLAARQRFSWDANAQALHALYREVCC